MSIHFVARDDLDAFGKYDPTAAAPNRRSTIAGTPLVTQAFYFREMASLERSGSRDDKATSEQTGLCFPPRMFVDWLRVRWLAGVPLRIVYTPSPE